MGDLINGAVRHHIKYVDHPQEPNKIGLFKSYRFESCPDYVAQ